MTKKRIIWIIIIIVVLGLLAWPKLMPDKSGQQAAAPANAKKAPVPVSVYVVKHQDVVRSIEATGSLLAEDEVELHSEAQGRISKIYFAEGSEVHKGQLLLKVNDADLQAQLAKAVSVKKLNDQTEQRNKQLLAKGAISQETYDLSFTNVSAANADIDLLKESIRRTELIAPFNGVIGLKYVSDGSFVTPTTKIASLQGISHMKVEFSVPEKYASQLKKDMPVTFRVEGYHPVVSAKIYAIEPKVESVTRNVVMRAICDNSERKLLPGAFAKVSIPLQNNPNSITVPTQSIVPILKGQKVYLLKGDSVIERVVKTGVRSDTYIEVTDGLQPGDSVVVNGVMYLKQGAKVKVTKG